MLLSRSLDLSGPSVKWGGRAMIILPPIHCNLVNKNCVSLYGQNYHVVQKWHGKQGWFEETGDGVEPVRQEVKSREEGKIGHSSYLHAHIYLLRIYLRAHWVLGMVLKLEDTMLTRDWEPLLPPNVQCWLRKCNALFNECSGTWTYVSKRTYYEWQGQRGLKQTEWNQYNG